MDEKIMDHSLQPYWPDNTHVSECIRAMAESDSNLVLLAAHKPMTLHRKSLGRDKRIEVKKELDLLEAFLQQTQDGFLLMPITGESGMGKSHMIRWLDAHLKLKPDWQQKYHIVRIPKGVSMREVLWLILQDIPGETFDALRGEIDRAVDEQDEEHVKQILRANLLTELHHVHEKLKDKSADVFQLSQKEMKKLQLSGSAMLSAYLADPALANIFMQGEGCFSQLAQSHMHGCKTEDPKTQFSIDDLKLNDESIVKETSTPTQRAYRELNNGNLWQDAAELLNSVIDKALNPLMTVGSKSVVDLFVDVRKALYKNNKELVLLIEDFAAMAGIQEVILDIAIREADRGDAVQQMCVMRTAIAMTSNYLTNRDTINTRAVYEWIVEEDNIPESTQTAFDQLVDKTTDFCGRYLNAARYGIEGLAQLRLGITDGQGKGVIPFRDDNLTEDDESLLIEFGVTQDGYHLFPLNRAAIEGLVRYHLYDKSTKSYKFNPRTVINKLLRETLLEQRNPFFNGSFPSESFPESSFSLEVEREIYDMSPTEHQRLSRLLWYWGGVRHSLGEVQLPKALFSRLGMPVVSGDEGGTVTTLPEIGTTGKTPTSALENKQANSVSTPNKPENLVEPPEVSKWKDTLDGWLKPGGDLATSSQANQIRKWIFEALADALDTSCNALLPLKDLQGQLFQMVYLAGARGNRDISQSFVTLISEKELKSQTSPSARYQVFEFLMARVRYEYLGNKKWNYPEGPKDYLAYTCLVSRLLPDAIKSYQLWSKDKIKTTVGALCINSTFLGLVKGSQAKQLIEGMLYESVAAIDKEPKAQAWHELREHCALYRDELQATVLQLFGRFQGATGKECFALDTEPLTSYLNSDFRKNWGLGDQPMLKDKQDQIKTHCHKLKQTRNLKFALNEKKDYLMSLFNAYDALAQGESKADLNDTLSNVITAFSESGLSVNGRSSEQMLEEVKEFNKLALSDSLNVFQILTTDENVTLSEQVRAATMVDEKVVLKATHQLQKISDYLVRVQSKMEEAQGAQCAVDNVENDIRELLNTLIDVTKEIPIMPVQQRESLYVVT